MTPHSGRGSKLVVQEATPDWTAGTFENVMITLMMKRGTPAQMRRLQQIHDGWYAKHPQGIATFNIVLPSTLLPEQGAHEAAAAALSAMQDHHLASTTVILGDGFWAATMRSLLTTIFAVSRSRVPQKVASTVEEGAELQSMILGAKGPTTAGLIDACRTLIRSYDADTK